MSANGISRREVLVRAAAAAASLGLSASVSSRERASGQAQPEPDRSTDNATLNALLAAEYDAIATYNAGVRLIARDVATPQATRELVTSVAVHFLDHHSQHAAALRRSIQDNGGVPVLDLGLPKLPVTFPASSATTSDVIKLAADKEKQAAFVYAQVMSALSASAAATLVASIGAVETQHFVVLHLLAEELISPTAKTAMNPALIVPAAFILDLGGAGTLNLEQFSALDQLLALDPA